MIGVFSALKSGLLKASSVNIDNNVCKLHYRATVVLLLAFSLLVTSRQYIGDPIDCMSSGNQIPKDVLDQFCWISSTFSIPTAFNKQVGRDVPYPGIDKHRPNEQRVYHQYYQWVCFVLFLQAMMFYIPHYLWKIWEGGRLKALIFDLKCPIVSADSRKEKRELLADYFVANLHNHNLYFIKFYITEILNLINVIGQIYFTDKFLGGEFTTFGTKVLQFTETDQESRIDPMVRIFPRITKCIFHAFGPSGDVQKHDALCILPINIINEKIYIFLWFWLIILSVITALSFIYRLLIVIFPHTRFFLLKMHGKILPSSEIEVITHKSQIGDWFILYQMSKNMEYSIYTEFLSTLGKRLNNMNSTKKVDV
ncbi:hypothetical protein CHUAL_012433 [Chamberlinius hualienensis]